MNENNNQKEKNTPVETPRVTARITWLNSEPDPTVDPRRATASITIADCFRVRGLAVFNGKNGLCFDAGTADGEQGHKNLC